MAVLSRIVLYFLAMARAKSSGISVNKRPGRPENLTPFKKGQSGNPKGKPPGTRDRRTVIIEALKLIATKKNMTPEQIEEAIQMAGIEKAIKGSFLHYAEISNGLYGKITDRMDVTSGGKTLADVIAAAAHAKRAKSK